MSRQEKNVRRAAVSVLRAWNKGHQYADSLVDNHARRNQLSTSDRALLNALTLAVLRHRRLLDYYISRIRKGKLDHETRDILRVGLAQILILNIPEHAAVNETVNCGRAPVRGLINAVLRRALDQHKNLHSEAEELPPAERLSHPDWLAKRWRRQFGKADTTTLMEWNNQPAPTYLRLNSLKAQSSELADHPELTACEQAPNFFFFEGPIPRDWINEGLVYAQDIATRHCVDLLAPQAGETIPDACAAPGGKAALIAAAMNNEGNLVCTDANEKRLPRLEENLTRLGVTMTEVKEWDWTKAPPEEWHQHFDAILLDVPCSNTGVLRRRVDARWRLKPEQFEELVILQRSILTNALACLKSGGRLVYSTCSIDEEENLDLIKTFAAENNLEVGNTHQSLPHTEGEDGAFAAILKKKP